MSAFTDSAEQSKVIHAPLDDNILVVAGAGSGKTYTMTRRIVTLIGEGVPPERILGLTFTRKAASELLSRVSSAVADSADGHAGGMFLKPEVSTYDAFFQSIVRQYGLLVGFDRDTQPLSDAGAISLVSEVIDRHRDLLSSHDFGAFSSVVGKVLGLSHAIGNAMIGGSIATVEDAIARIREWDREFLQRLDEAIGTRPIPLDEPKPKAPKPGKKGKDARYAAKWEEYLSDLEELCVWRCAELRDVTQRRELLLDLVGEYEREKRRQNMAEFSDFTVAAYQLVSRFPSISQRYRRRYSHVLLDEYQDTSTTQAMLIAALFHPTEKSAQDGSHIGEIHAMAGVKAAGRLHADVSSVSAVGDPFQSIYAWRGASPGAFRMFQRDFDIPDDAKPYPLNVTRRNPRVVLEAANNLTLPLRLPSDHGSSALLREVDVSELSADDKAPIGTVGVLGFDTFGQEIDAVARFARHAMEKYAFIRNEDGSRGARDTHPHVAVLFRGKTHMAQFAQGLEQSGLSTLVVGHSALLDRPDMQDLMALLHVVADHTDTGSLMRLLATPRFGLGSQDLSALASLADRLDTQYRYRSLVEAGLIDDVGGGPRSGSFGSEDDASRKRQADLVREYRDRIPHAVFVIDVLSRNDLARLLDQDGGFSRQGISVLDRAGSMIRQVQASVHRSLGEVVETAVQALDLDIDMLVAQAIAHPGERIDLAVARSGVDAVLSLIDTYTQEVIEGHTPSLRGFLSWVDSLKQVEDDSASMPDAPADVVLMTIHQAKGLEWDAVAVVGMSAGAFPSGKSGLRITRDDDHPGGFSSVSGRWTPPTYRTGMPTWIDDEASVPVPVRVDAGILPRFPHDADPDMDPAQSLRMLDDVVVIDDEIYGDMRAAYAGDEDGQDGSDADAWYLTQSEEYGRRLLADERRLAYVALTRTKHDALLTYSRYGEPGRDPRPVHDATGRRPSASSPSPFWSEVHDSLDRHDDLVSAQEPDAVTRTVDPIRDQDHGRGADTLVPSQQQKEESRCAVAMQTLESIGAQRPDGFFVGQNAADYKHAVIDEAWRCILEDTDSDGVLSWPSSLSAGMLRRLRRGVRELERARPHDDRQPGRAGGLARSSAVNGPVLESDRPQCHAMDDRQQDALLSRATMLIADPDLMPLAYDDDTLDERVKRQAMRLLRTGRQTVTSLQARAGRISDRRMNELWRGIVRPIPQVVSPAAQAGTLFHAWAERFVMAYDGDLDLLPDDGREGSSCDSSTDVMFATTPMPQSRAEMLDELSAREQALRHTGGMDAKESRLVVWQRRLAESVWASRRPIAAERQIVVAMPQLGDSIINGKLDAVFQGGLDESDATKRFTIVDWKTGVRPKRENDIDEKLIQLDWYRLLLSRMENVPLSSIDATLYYVSEPDKGLRELHASAKTEQEILAELSSGIPEQSDND